VKSWKWFLSDYDFQIRQQLVSFSSHTEAPLPTPNSSSEIFLLPDWPKNRSARSLSGLSTLRSHSREALQVIGFKESGFKFCYIELFFFHFQTSNVDLNFFNSLAYLLFSMCLSARFRKSINLETFFFRECLFTGLKLLKLFEFWILTIGTFSKGWSVKCQNYTIRFVKKNLRVFLLGKKIISHFINLLLQNADAYKILRKLFCILTVNHLKLKWF